MSEKPLGYVNFDPSRSGSTEELQVMIPYGMLRSVRLGQYVKIESYSDEAEKKFFGVITGGPFYEPDAVSKDSALARASILQAGSVSFTPDYHAVCSVQIMGELDDVNMRILGTFTRPRPQSKVRAITSDEIEKFLELKGDMYLGRLAGYSNVSVRLPSNKNAALPRNLGIFGTVGSGKTNTSQVLIEEASRTNWAVIVLDIEGEYVDMDSPSEEEQLYQKMKEFGIDKSGVSHMKAFHPVNTEPAREDSSPFSVRFSNIDPGIIAEIMDLTVPQNERFLETWYNLEQKEGRKGGGRSSSGIVGSMRDGSMNGRIMGITLDGMMEQIDTILANKDTKGANRVSYHALKSKLKKLKRYDIFDKPDLLNYDDMIKPNSVSVVDLSGSVNSKINNIVIVEMLRKVFAMKLDDREKALPPVLLVIEEAHTLVSKSNAGKMEETLDILREISRRGRKRWISLCFISQQPSHLPPEIYELCNTKITHQTTGGKNLDAIKGATGGVESGVWNSVPRLGQGTCLFISSYFKNRPMFVNMRPCTSKRRYVYDD